MKFPILFDNAGGRDPITHCGMASTAEEAIAVVSAPDGAYPLGEWENHSAVLIEYEASHAYKDKADLERAWAEEITAGYARPCRVGSGWVVIIDTWEIAAS